MQKYGEIGKQKESHEYNNKTQEIHGSAISGLCPWAWEDQNPLSI